MIVHLHGIHLTLTDDRFSLVMDALEECFRALRHLGAPPLQVDVVLKKTVRRAPKTRRGDRLYRTRVTVDIPGRSLHADGTDDVLSRAVARMAGELASEIRAWSHQRSGQPKSGGRPARAHAENPHVPVLSTDPPAGES